MYDSNSVSLLRIIVSVW